eukprot:g4048.t1
MPLVQSLFFNCGKPPRNAVALINNILRLTCNLHEIGPAVEVFFRDYVTRPAITSHGCIFFRFISKTPLPIQLYESQLSLQIH